MSGRVIGGQRAAIPSEPSKQQGDLCHTRHPRVIETLRQPRNHPQQKRKEGDLIIGTMSRSAIGTLVERSSRFVTLVHLQHDHTAETVRDGLVKTVAQLPATLRRSLTWDQGAEMSGHVAFRVATDMDVYFCDPASPWQRGSNENTNGLLRQYFPKGTDLSRHTPDELQQVAAELNARPRKSLGWDTPAERLRALLEPS
jgi:IS30 family transposase